MKEVLISKNFKRKATMSFITFVLVLALIMPNVAVLADEQATMTEATAVEETLESSEALNIDAAEEGTKSEAKSEEITTEEEKTSAAIQSADEAMNPAAGAENTQELSEAEMMNSSSKGGPTYPLTIKIYNGNDSYITRTYNSPSDPLGQVNVLGGRSNWSYNTFHSVPIGFSTDPRFKEQAEIHSLSDSDVIYRDIEPVSSVPGLSNDTVLYPVTFLESDLMAMFPILQQEGSLHISKHDSVNSVVEGDIFKAEGFGEGNADKKLATIYYSTREKYSTNFISDYEYADTRMPYLVIENPFGLIKGVKGVSDFTGGGQNPDATFKPTGYSYEDLRVIVDPNSEVSVEQKNWIFESSTFMVAQVLDKNYNALTMTYLEQPGHDSIKSVFSFENPNMEREFIIRTVVRNDIGNGTYTNDNFHSNNILSATGAEAVKPMRLYSGDSGNIYISKEKALEYSKSGEEIEFKGNIGGSFAVNKNGLVGGAAILKYFIADNYDIVFTKSKNTVNFAFKLPVVKFDKNATATGDTQEQKLGYSNFVLDSSIGGDELNTGALPSLEPANITGDSMHDYIAGQYYEINGAKYLFKGWNTKADRSGAYVSNDTLLNRNVLNPTAGNVEDLTLYAAWDVDVKHVYKQDSADEKTIEIPAGLLARRPADTSYPLGKANVAPSAFDTSDYVDDVNKGVWSWKGWDISEIPNLTAPSVFTGYWSFKSEKISIDLSGLWADDNNSAKLRPDSMSLKLLADGKEAMSVVISKDGNWKNRIEGLEKYNNGKEIIYTIAAVTVSNYESTVSGDMGSGFVIKNTLKSSQQAKPSPSAKAGTVNAPKTGDIYGVGLFVLLMLISLCGMITLKLKRAKNK